MLKALVKAPLLFLAARFGQHRRATAGEKRLWILMYHRVLPSTDPRFALEEPGMLVTPESLAMQLDIAKSLFTVVDLGEWIDKYNKGEPLPDKACAITFDDGWVDNLEYALPILEKAKTPATIFVVPEMIGTTKKFWPNRLAELILQTGEAWQTAEPFQWLHQHLASRGMNIAKADSSPETIALIIDHCKSLSDKVLDANISESEKMLKGNTTATTGETPANTSGMINDKQLQQLAEHPLIAIGSHTCNHFRLNETLESETVEREICESKQQLENRLNLPVPLFCYPNGDYTKQARDLVAREYRAAVTTQRGINTAGADLHELKRVAVNEGGSNSRNKFEALLSGWFN